MAHTPLYVITRKSNGNYVMYSNDKVVFDDMTLEFIKSLGDFFNDVAKSIEDGAL